MRPHSRWRRVAVIIATLPLLLCLSSFLAPAAVLAEGGLALSGSFHGQDFIIPQGASVSGPSVDVVVFNNSSVAMNIKMLSQAPPGITIGFSTLDFTIKPDGQQQVFITIAVAADVSPGEYELNVIAKSYKEGGTGIQVAGAAGQIAKLTVTGQSASVTMRALSPDGQSVVADIRLYRLVNGQNYEMAYSKTGTLQATVAPGDFKADSYIGGQQVAEQSFTLANGDSKMIDLTGATIYFASFGLVPNYTKDTDKLAFVQVVYTVKNIYQQVSSGDVILQVTLNGVTKEPLTLMTLSPLAVGSSGLYYNYIPTEGWAEGSYDFQLQLKLDGRIYSTSTVEQIVTTASKESTIAPISTGADDSTNTTANNTASKPASGGKGTNAGVIIGITAGAVAVITAAFVFLRKKKVMN